MTRTSTVTLIAEDTPPVHYLLKTYSQMCGFQTVQATVGERALEMARQDRPALVLLNIDLPGNVRGWEVLECLKEDESTRSILVVIYHLEKESPDEPWATIADAWLPIPLLYESFKETLTRAGVLLQKIAEVPSQDSRRAGRGLRAARNHPGPLQKRRPKKRKEETRKNE
jgi:CheY-like chemotaxis protein